MLTNFHPSNLSSTSLLILAVAVFSAAGTTAAAANCLSVPAGGALITVDSTHYDDQGILYSVGTGTQTSRCLKTMPGDQLTWKAKTSGANHRMMIYFPSLSTPFISSTGNHAPIYAFHGSQADESSGSSNIGNGSQVGPNQATFKFSVVVADDAQHETYNDDPKIIVGHGVTPEEQLESATRDLEELLQKYPSDFKQQVEKIEDRLEQIVRELK